MSCLDVEGGGGVQAGVWGLQCVWIVVSTQPQHHQHNNKTSLCIICLIQGGWGVGGCLSALLPHHVSVSLS